MNRPTYMHHLWHALLQDLTARLKATKRVPMELLSVARGFLRDNRQGATSERDRKALEQLHRLHSARLAEALLAARPSAGALAESRKWLQMHGVRADLPTAVARQVAQKLADGSLPFTHENKLTEH